jgi:hypothetical protein
VKRQGGSDDHDLVIGGEPVALPTTPHGVREALASSLVTRDDRTLGRLATQVEVAVRRAARADGGPPRCVMLDRNAARGPWLGYLLRPDGSGCWLVLGWKPSGETSAVRQSLPLELDDYFHLTPIDGAPSSFGPFADALVWVEYSGAALPSEHRLLNDLHALVMLHDLLSEQVGQEG